MNARRFAMICLLLLAGLLPAEQLCAQDDGQAKATTTELVPTATLLKRRLDEFLKSMDLVAQQMEKTDPDVAAILQRTVTYAQSQLVADNMDAVVRALQQGRDEIARSEQTVVIEKLTQMLRILEGGIEEQSQTEQQLAQRQEIYRQLQNLLEAHRDEERRTRAIVHKDEIDQASAALIQDLERAIARQKELAKQTQQLDAPEAAMDAVSRLRRQVQDAIEQQGAIRDRTWKAPLAELPVLAEAQRTLGQGAKTLKEQADQVGQNEAVTKALSEAGLSDEILAQVGSSLTSAAEEMNRAADGLDQSSQAKAQFPQAQALADLAAAAKALDAAIEGLSAETPAGALAGQQGDLGEQTRALDDAFRGVADNAGIDPAEFQPPADQTPQGDLNKAADHMNQASQRIAEQDKPSAGQQQDQALSELEEKLLQAKELRRRAMEKAQAELDATRQNQLAKDAQDLSDKMNDAQTGQAMAGKSSVSAGAQSSKSAGSKMGQGDSAGANQDQQDAVKKLQQAGEELAAEIERLEQRSRQEQLERIEDRLAGVLETQKALSQTTKETYVRRAAFEPLYDRAAQQELSKASTGEGDLADEIASILEQLLQDGSTVVFPKVLLNVKEDLLSVQKRLAAMDPGALTQTQQAQIEQMLDELLHSIRDELSKGPGRGMSGGAPGPGGGGGGSSPLIPPLAELRMLWRQQSNVYRSTQQLDELLNAETISEQEYAQQVAKVAERQAQTKDLAERLANKLNETEQPTPAEGGAE